LQSKQVRRYEKIIRQLQKLLESEKSQVKQLKIVSAKEIESKNELERVLKLCVEDVKIEL